MAFTRNGYGQVEPNQLSAQKTGQIYASLPLASDVNVLQNGEFMYYDYKSGTVTADGIGEPMLVFNEIKLYEEPYRTTYKDFALIRVNSKNAAGETVQGENYVTSALATAGYGDGAGTTGVGSNGGYRLDGFAPRVFKTNIGDVMTTNMVKTGVDYAQGYILVPKKNATSKTLVLEINDATSETTKKTLPASGMAWVVAQVYTMPDGQPGLKLQRVQ